MSPAPTVSTTVTLIPGTSTTPSAVTPTKPFAPRVMTTSCTPFSRQILAISIGSTFGYSAAISSSLNFTTLLIFIHFSTSSRYLTKLGITLGLMFGSKTIGANSPTFTAQSYRTLAPGSIIVTKVPICRTSGFSCSGSGNQELSKANVAVPSIRNS